MNALDRLSGFLRRSLNVAESISFAEGEAFDIIINKLETHNKIGSCSSVPEDLQLAAVRRFWDIPRVETLRDARLVSFGLCVPNCPSGPCILEDRKRFRALLDNNTGINKWIDEPRWYRRCYQGLVRSYFTYDGKAAKAHAIGKQNWIDLRAYLNENITKIVDKKVNPDWVTTVGKNTRIFDYDPCNHYAAEYFAGDTRRVDQICEQLGIVKSSWFLRELVLAQVRVATTFSYDRFKELIPRLIAMLSNNLVLRDKGLILILDKYASTSHPGINDTLRNTSVDWWGNPWLPSNETRWGGVIPEARKMVSEWLKREFIEAFFTKLAEDGVGDKRRANFWLRYVKSMDVQFALGARALHSRDRDFEVLRKKMKGLYTELKTSDSSNNAFIMTLGNLVAVEFGGMGNAFYGYDKRKALPFDASLPVGTAINERNSLKNDNRILKMSHKDGIKGHEKWENLFEETLKQQFGISPYADGRQTHHRPFTDNTAQPSQSEKQLTLATVMTFARDHGLKVEDLRKLNGNLWVRTDDKNIQVNRMLSRWGFKYKPGKGWWR